MTCLRDVMCVAIMESANEFRVIPYPSEFVLQNRLGERIIAFPTEQEAYEYLRELNDEEN